MISDTHTLTQDCFDVPVLKVYMQLFVIYILFDSRLSFLYFVYINWETTILNKTINSAGDCWILAFVWMLLNKQPCWSFLRVLLGTGTLWCHCSLNRTPHIKHDLELGTWSDKALNASTRSQNHQYLIYLIELQVLCLKNYDLWHAVRVRGFTLSETMSGRISLSNST